MTNTSNYPRVAFCSALTPATPEYYQSLKNAGINTVSVCLDISGYNYYKFASMHTKLAREAGMVTHAFMLTDLTDPTGDVTSFTQRFTTLQFPTEAKITILVNSDQYVEERESKILKMMNILSKYHAREYIDLAFFKKDIDEELYNLRELPETINLTIINCTPHATSSGIPITGTWIYTSSFCDQVQFVGYDFYSYYTAGDYQLSLIDTTYTVQKGDSWHSISKRHGIPMLDLLHLNGAVLNDKIFEGQIIKIA